MKYRDFFRLASPVARPDTARMRIVLLGDIHVYALAVWPWEMLNKRLLGQLNLWFNRRKHFDLSRLPGMVERVASLEPDTILYSGDVSTTALPREFERFMQTVACPLDAFASFAVPGNHDRYTGGAMRGRYFEAALGDRTADDWPHVRKLAEGVTLVGLDPTRPTGFNATGELGTAQLDALRGRLNHIDPTDRVIVLCHYPIGTPPHVEAESSSHGLADCDRLVDTLADAPQRIVYLHGHIHRPWCWRLDGRADNVVAVNAGAPIMADRDHPAGQGFWEIECDAGDPLAFTHHVPSPDGGWRADTIAVPDVPGTAAALP